jgi:hypothetical protein
MNYLKQLDAISAALAESNKTPFERALAEVMSVAPTLSMINGRYFLDDSPLAQRQVEAIYFAVVQKKPDLVRTVTLDIFRKAVHAVAARNPAKEDPMLAPVKAIVAGALADVNAGRPPIEEGVELGSMIILKRVRPTYVVTHRSLRTNSCRRASAPGASKEPPACAPSWSAWGGRSRPCGSRSFDSAASSARPPPTRSHRGRAGANGRGRDRPAAEILRPSFPREAQE